MLNAREGEVRPATTASASSVRNNNNTRKPSNTPTNKLTAAASTTHDNQPNSASTRKRVNNSESSNEPLTPLAPAAALSSSSSPPMPQVHSQIAMSFALAAPAAASTAIMSPEVMDLLKGSKNVVPVSMGVAWQQSANANAAAAAAAMYQQQQQQSTLKIRPFPVPPSITIPPPPPPPGLNPQVLFTDVDVSMTPRDFGKMSPALGPSISTGFPAPGSMLAMSPLHFHLPPGPSSDGASAILPSPLKVNVVLRPKPTTDGTIPPAPSDASPVSPTALKDMQFAAPRFVPDMWTFESPPTNIYAMLIHQPQPLDLSYEQMTAAMVAPQHMNHHTIQFQAEAHQQLQLQQQQQGGFGIQTSPLAARMHQLYPHMNPVMVTNPHHHHQLQLAMPTEHHGAATSPGAFSPTVNFSMINFSEIMMLGGDGSGGGGDPGLFLPQGSPTSNILKHMLPPVIPHHCGVNVKDITLNELRPHFNKPMAAVAKELGVCITLMKKICRRNGLVRWPHRRIRSLVNRITSLQVIAANASDAEQKRVQSQIATLREELSAVIQNPNEKSRKAQADAKARSPSSMKLVKEEDADDDDDDDDDEDDEDGRKSVKSDQSISSNTNTRKKPPGVEGNVSLESSEPLVQEKQTSEDVDMQDHETSSKSAAGTVGDSKKRKELLECSGTALYPPPPIKIPCYHDGRTRRNSAPEQQHLHALSNDGRVRDEASDVDTERPSSTTSTSSRRGSILSILCDSAE